MRIHRLKLTAALLCLGLLGTGAVAHAELGQKGNVRIAFHGGISPVKLPRSGKNPIGILLGASISTTDCSVPPKLQRIILEVNSHGKMDASGLPTCSLGKLTNASTQQAERACGPAQVGHGNVTTQIAFPGQSPFSTVGPMLAFNARYKGHQAIFAHVNSNSTLASTYVIVFQVKKSHGTYGTKLDATLPSIASGHGFIKGFDLSLKRKFTVHGKKHSFLTAFCPAPKGVSQAGFSFARSTFDFEGGTSLSIPLTRTCKATK